MQFGPVLSYEFNENLSYLDLQSVCFLMLLKFNIESLLGTHFYTEKAFLSPFLIIEKFLEALSYYIEVAKVITKSIFVHISGNILPSKISKLSKNDMDY